MLFPSLKNCIRIFEKSITDSCSNTIVAAWLGSVGAPERKVKVFAVMFVSVLLKFISQITLPAVLDIPKSSLCFAAQSFKNVMIVFCWMPKPSLPRGIFCIEELGYLRVIFIEPVPVTSSGKTNSVQTRLIQLVTEALPVVFDAGAL